MPDNAVTAGVSIRVQRFTRALLLFCVSAVAVREPAAACQCGDVPSPARAVAEAEAAFAGVVVALNDVTVELPAAGRHEKRRMKEVQFRVNRFWKGRPNRTATLLSGFGNCDYAFTEGHSYLVYAEASEVPKRFRATICLPTKAYADAKKDIAEIGSGKPATD